MPKVEGVDRLMRAFDRIARRADEDGRASVTVGYTQQYAVFVHEDLAAKHRAGKTAKFLETPTRRLAPELGKLIGDGVKRGMTLVQALLVAGLRIQRESQQVVPIDTGALKASAFTAPTDQVAAAAGAAYEQSLAVKAAAGKRRK